MILARVLERAGRHPRLALAAVIAAALLAHAPSLAWGFFADDYAHQLVLGGERVGTMRPWSLYDFGSGDGAAAEALEQSGFPWWISADWRARFFRPLASLSLWLDHALFGGFALGYHLSSLAWYALALVLVHALYRTAGLGPKRALFALLVFALHAGSAMPVGWTANRNSLVALVFEVAAVLAVIRAPPLDPRAPRAVAPARVALALALALCAALAKESGVAAFALIALVLCWRARRLTVVAAIALAAGAAYFAWYLAAGYGARGPFYPSPWTDPADFARNLLLIAPGSVPSLCGVFSLDMAFLRSAWRPALLAAAIPMALAIGAAARPALRGSPSAPLWVGWWLLTLLPVAGAPPSERLLFSTSVAGAALIAELAARALAPSAARPLPMATRWLARVLLVTTTAGAFLWLQAGQFAAGSLAEESRRAVLGTDVGDPALGPREVFVLQSPNALVALSPAATWVVEGGDRSVRFWVLQLGRRGLRWRRTEADAFELTSLDRPFLDHPFEEVFLARRARPVFGERWTRSLFEVEALEVDAGGLRRVRFRVRGDLGDPRLRFVTWRDGRWSHVPTPEVGGELVLPEVEASVPLMP